jgi:hypothetical protein
MEYTQVMLFGLGMLGIFLHNLVKMDSLNRQAAGNFNLLQYLKIEKFSILISLGVIIAATVASHEVKELAIAGKYLAFGFISIGYLAQSLLVKLMGTAQKKLDNTLKIKSTLMTVYVPLEEKSDYINKVDTTIVAQTAISYVANSGGTAWFENDAPNIYPDLVIEGSWETPPVVFINGAGVQSVELLGGGHPPVRPR